VTHPGRKGAAPQTAAAQTVAASPGGPAPAQLAGARGASPTGAETLPGIATIAGPMLKRVSKLPDGPLYWQIENFPSMAAARAAEGPTSVALEAEGKAWLFTVTRQGQVTPGATNLAEVGPLPIPNANEYMLQISYQSRAPGVIGTTHSHPGVECWYMVQGEQILRLPTEGRQVLARAGEALLGPPADTPLQIVTSGSGERRAFNLFVLDAGRPASAEGADVATVDAAFKEAFKARDLDATMDLFAAETVEISPFGIFPGRDAIRRSVETFIRANPGLDVSFGESEIVRNTAVHRVLVTSDPIRATGVERLVLIHTLVVTRGKIVAIAQQLDLNDVDTAQYSLGLAPEGR
jgi:hypothetical protein